MLNRDPEFRSGMNGIDRYNNGTVGNVVVERTTDVNLPNQSGYKLKITTSGPATPGLGGFYFGTETRANAVFITRFIAWVPVGYRIEWATNYTGNGGTSKWLTNNVGTGDWEEYAFYVKSGSSGTFSSTNYFYLAGGDGSLPVTWYLAFATVYDAGSIDDTPTKDELKRESLLSRVLSIYSGKISVLQAWLLFPACRHPSSKISRVIQDHKARRVPKVQLDLPVLLVLPDLLVLLVPRDHKDLRGLKEIRETLVHKDLKDRRDSWTLPLCVTCRMISQRNSDTLRMTKWLRMLLRVKQLSMVD